MKLSEFKKGDIIHRTKPIKIEKSILDFGFDIFPLLNISRTYIELPLIFVGIKSGLLFFRYADEKKGSIQRLALDIFDDHNWDYFPTEYLEDKSEKLKN